MAAARRQACLAALTHLLLVYIATVQVFEEAPFKVIIQDRQP
jgi:hypothetical protein